MFASTSRARALLKLAFKAANTEIPSHTYTEKTSEYDKARRSVVFQVSRSAGPDVLTFAKAFFEETGYTESTPKLTVSPGPYGGYSYIRVIAYKD